jgi:DNA repair exonuclease SbcCD ATPase subunit
MTELRMFMNTRRTQIQKELAPLLERRQALRTELDEINVKLARLKRELDEINQAEQAIGGTGQSPHKTELTIKAAVLMVLEEEKRGMTAQQILAAINERYFEGKIARSSLSPQLSRLNHDDEKVTFDGTLWSLRTENDEGPANAEPSFLD